MRVLCAPLSRGFSRREAGERQIVLYSQADRESRGAAGSGIADAMNKLKLKPAVRAWDLLSIALAIIAADASVRRAESPDGWTRQIDLCVSVSDTAFWMTQRGLIDQLLRFLTNDLWQCNFIDGGFLLAPPAAPTLPEEDCVSLLSGGLDSLIGVLDLVARSKLRPFVVSQVSQGDKETQADFARRIGGGLRHLQLNHNVKCPSGNENENSQRARSLIFLAYGVLAATTLRRYQGGENITLYVSENGFISINPPLTGGRLGSLSTRTTHPFFLRLFQQLLDSAGLRVRIENPCQLLTKGEMMVGCAEQEFLLRNAHRATSCGRFARYAYRHCGRCVPCLVRRAAFLTWGKKDGTVYVFRNLSQDSDDYARFDDVRSAAMAVAQVRAEGVDRWIGASLSTTLLGDVVPYKQTVERGLREIGNFLDAIGVR